MMDERDTPSIETCILVAGSEARYDDNEVAALNAELAHLRRVAEAARQLCLSITACQLYPASRKWQANGGDNTLPKLEEATEAWCKWARKRQEGEDNDGR